MALLISCRTWTQTKTRGIFCEKVFYLRIWISNIYLLRKQWVYRKDIDTFLFIFKITAHHDFISKFNFQLIEWVFLIKHDPSEELLNHIEVNYFFMPNFHYVRIKPWLICRKDISEGQKWYQKLKLRLQPKGLFRTIHYLKSIYKITS